MTGWVEKVVGNAGDKRRWKQYRARAEALPAGYREAQQALERYLTRYGAITKGDTFVTMLEDLVELIEQGAADGTALRGIVGEDPVAFAEDFLANYAEDQWISKERARLAEAIDRAAGAP
ncbi:DUF1048 domain-containing protein [Citricoccus sp. NPDC079358]|jgi:DNA-binding ferritin-like protein (Dps family)|uniref:DUF1048 domain-containing protein n=1 Tax=Citricoccus sp. NPDC079358 TaxID=3154653 RepID=UPI00344CE67B